MYLAYIDASGRPIKGDKDTKNYVLASLIAHERNWQYIDNQVEQIKLKHFPYLIPTDIELHAKDMLNREGVFKRLDFDEIYAIFDDVFEVIADKKTDICIISIVISKHKMLKGKDIEKWAYRLLVERINKFLEKQNEKLTSTEIINEFRSIVPTYRDSDVINRLKELHHEGVVERIQGRDNRLRYYVC